MKNFLTFLIFLFSVSFSQTYVCSETIKGVELEKNTYEKVDDYMYLKTLNTGENQNFKIVNETESFVVLVQSFTFPGLFVTIIDKTNNTFVEDTLLYGNNQIINNYISNYLEIKTTDIEKPRKYNLGFALSNQDNNSYNFVFNYEYSKYNEN